MSSTPWLAHLQQQTQAAQAKRAQESAEWFADVMRQIRIKIESASQGGLYECTITPSSTNHDEDLSNETMAKVMNQLSAGGLSIAKKDARQWTVSWYIQ